VKVLRRQNRFVVQLSQQEEHLLLEVLSLYPCIPPAHHRINRPGQAAQKEDCQRLLDEALAEQRAENKRHLQALLTDPKHLKRSDTGSQITFSAAELEWLLQILNDVRVGSWVLLGAPPERIDLNRMTKANAPHYWAMELSGHFQMHLLEALHGGA
jgi:hypothetical protein